MASEEKDLLAEQSASNLRTLLISEIQEFIQWLELKLPVEQLVIKRDKIRHLLTILSAKENIEFDKIVGKYFPDFAENSFNSQYLIWIKDWFNIWSNISWIIFPIVVYQLQYIFWLLIGYWILNTAQISIWAFGYKPNLVHN